MPANIPLSRDPYIASLISRYDHMKSGVHELVRELSQLENPEVHPALLGVGEESRVFSIVHDGTTYAVRIPIEKDTGEHVVADHAEAAEKAQGAQHLEHMVAVSFEDGITISHVMPGVTIGKLNAEDIRNVSGVHVRGLVQTIRDAHQRGLAIDGSPNNFFYDQSEGFGIIDYFSAAYSKTSLGETVGHVVASFDNASIYGRNKDTLKTVEDYKQDQELHLASIELIERYRFVVEYELDGQDRQDALQLIDKRLESSRETHTRYSDPQYVQQRISAQRELLAKTAAKTQGPLVR